MITKYSQKNLFPGASGGQFEIWFNNERSFTIFGSTYAKCYANFSVKGRLNAPVRADEHFKYTIEFDLECGCNTAVGEFKKAYNKTYSNSETKNVLDYGIQLLACKNEHRPIKSPKSQIQEAHTFFNDLDLENHNSDLNSYSDKDGMIEFIVANELTEDPIVMENLAAQKKDLIGISSIVTAYINRYAEKYGKMFKYDPDLWALATSKIPLMGPSTIESQSYSRNSIGVDIATDFIEFIAEIVVSEGSSALLSFTKFLGKQGDAIKFGIDQSKDFYETFTLGVTCEVFTVGDTIMYAPKIKQYRARFDRENFSFSSSCSNVNRIKIEFEYKYAANVFDYEALEDPEIDKAFRDFVREQRKAQIEDADTFFNEDFPTDNVPKLEALESNHQ